MGKLGIDTKSFNPNNTFGGRVTKANTHFNNES